ncbi:adhesive plaque matrix protein 2-like [Corticium candelabrum]|uniref:adhesive plaque matrix protein 2-like n=1 Tax=Corticium candelabrum TaxID=121492 RepID=UPI002E26C2D7|nr:adhesive plaque matrix protein 2-like [Corticium candelabrum]
MTEWTYAIVCLLALSTPVTRAACDVCSSNCPYTASLDNNVTGSHGYEVRSVSCADSAAFPQLLSVRVSPRNGGNDNFTVTVMDPEGYDDFVRHKGLFYSYFPLLSTGGVGNGSNVSTCFSKSAKAVVGAGTKAYVVIGCVNQGSECNLTYGIDHTCLVSDACSSGYCGSRGVCGNKKCVCNAGYTGDRCESVDRCYGIDCGSHGNCTDGMCDCDGGYSGNRCETFDVCYGVSCGSHGTCRSGACVCNAGYHGDSCQSSGGNVVLSHLSCFMLIGLIILLSLLV